MTDRLGSKFGNVPNPTIGEMADSIVDGFKSTDFSIFRPSSFAIRYTATVATSLVGGPAAGTVGRGIASAVGARTLGPQVSAIVRFDSAVSSAAKFAETREKGRGGA